MRTVNVQLSVIQMLKSLVIGILKSCPLELSDSSLFRSQFTYIRQFFFLFFFFFFLYVCFNISVAVTIHNERENNPIVPPCYYTTVYTYMHLILLKIKFVPRYTILNKVFKLQRKNNIILKIVILL